MSLDDTDSLTVRFARHFPDQRVNRLSRHLLHIHLVSGDRHITKSREKIIVISHNRYILRHTVSVLMQPADQKTRRQITVAHKSRRHLLGQLQQPVHINLAGLDVTVWDHPVLPHRNAMLHQGFHIPQIAVRDGSRRKQGSHIGNLPVSHVEQVIRHADRLHNNCPK